MGQITKGIRSVLSYPFIYDLSQKIMGAERIRKELVEKHIKPQQNDNILDIGCGTAEILTHLPNFINYWGYDISPEYITKAQNKFGNRGHFYCTPLTIENSYNLPKFNTILAIGVLHHLNDEEIENICHMSSKLLAKNGKFISIDPCYDIGQNSIAHFLISKDRGQNVRDKNGYYSLAKSYFKKINGTLKHRKWIPYTHWIMECSI